jgi:hypothetical protein
LGEAALDDVTGRTGFPLGNEHLVPCLTRR